MNNVSFDNINMLFNNLIFFNVFFNNFCASACIVSLRKKQQVY